MSVAESTPRPSEPLMLREALAEIKWSLAKIDPRHYLLTTDPPAFDRMASEFFAALAERGLTVTRVRKGSRSPGGEPT